MTQQWCCVSFTRQPANILMSQPVDPGCHSTRAVDWSVAGVGDAGCGDAGGGDVRETKTTTTKYHCKV